MAIAPFNITWVEPVKTQSPSSATVGGGEASITRDAIFDSEEGVVSKLDIISNVLGYPVYVPLTRSINRILPAQDPELIWCWATSVNNLIGIGGMKKITTNVGSYAAYARYRAQVVLRSRPYAVLPNSQVIIADTNNPLDGTVSEWKRWTVFIAEQGLEVISKLGNKYTYVPPSPFLLPVAGKIQTRAPKGNVFATWHNVPHQVVYGPESLYQFNDNWLNTLGTVNQFNWPDLENGYDPGTLLFTSIKTQPTEENVPPLAMDLQALGVPRSWTVTFGFQIYTPPQDPTAVGLGFRPSDNGHNLVPLPGGGVYYYLATSDRAQGDNAAGTLAGRRIYQDADFDVLFLGPS